MRPVVTIHSSLRDYQVEHCKPNGIPCKRIGYAAERLCKGIGRDKDVTRLKRADIRSYRAQRLTDGVTDSTVRRELGVLSAALHHAAKEERIAAVPLVELPPEGEPRRRALTQEEVSRLVAHPMSLRCRTFVLIALATGARAGAIEELKWSQVDLARGIIDFRVAGARKTKKRRAVVPIADFLTPVLTDLKAKATHDFVLDRGRSIYFDVRKALAGIGIKEKGVACHVFRKTFATLAIQSGVELSKVAAALGDTTATTEKNYVHLLPHALMGAVNAAQPKGM